MKPYIKSVTLLNICHTDISAFEKDVEYTFDEFEKMCIDIVFNAYDALLTTDVLIKFSDGHVFTTALSLATMQDHGVEHHLKRRLEVAQHPASDTYWNALDSRKHARATLLELADKYHLGGSAALNKALDTVNMKVGIVKMEMVYGVPVVTVDMSDISGRHQPYLMEVHTAYMLEHDQAPRDYRFLENLNAVLEKSLRKISRGRL